MERRKKTAGVEEEKDLLNQDVLKYTFMIVPLKFKGRVDNEKIAGTDFFMEGDRSKIKFDRLYKHVADCLDKNNADRSIYDFWVDRERVHCDVFRTPLSFKAVTETKQTFVTQGYLKDAFVYLFTDGIGFIVLNFVFDVSTDINAFCELMNKLKKLNRQMDNTKLEITRGGEEVNVFSLIEDIARNLGLDCDLFFQHSSKNYVSAVMLNAFTHDKPLPQEQIIEQLACLKRSQGNSYGTCDEAQDYLHPFKNMYWAFSTQGVANITYFDPKVGNTAFLKSFYNNITREYLLMTLIVLNQEYTLLDYCQKFVATPDEIPSVEELNRLYNFKIHSTYTTVSHLEHYRNFYSRFMEEMGISRIMEEVDVKQNSIYLTNKNRQEEERRRKEDERTRRSKHLNDLIKVLSAMLSVFGVVELINNVAYFMEAGNSWNFPISRIIFIVIGSVIGVCLIAVITVMIISIISEKRNARRGKRDDAEK